MSATSLCTHNRHKARSDFFPPHPVDVARDAQPLRGDTQMNLAPLPATPKDGVADLFAARPSWLGPEPDDQP